MKSLTECYHHTGYTLQFEDFAGQAKLKSLQGFMYTTLFGGPIWPCLKATFLSRLPRALTLAVNLIGCTADILWAPEYDSADRLDRKFCPEELNSELEKAR